MITLIDYYGGYIFSKEINAFIGKLNTAWPHCEQMQSGPFLVVLFHQRESTLIEEAMKLGFLPRRFSSWRNGGEEFLSTQDNKMIYIYAASHSIPEDEYLIWDDYRSH